jgi:hypothetical protein
LPTIIHKDKKSLSEKLIEERGSYQWEIYTSTLLRS